jgi:hypothetical protein
MHRYDPGPAVHRQALLTILHTTLPGRLPVCSETGYVPKNRGRLQDNHNIFNECPWSLETGQRGVRRHLLRPHDREGSDLNK